MHLTIGLTLPNPMRIAAIATTLLACIAPIAQADIDGHGPDSWRVTGVATGDTLNARMGPSTDYSTIEQFASNETGLQQITCVPYLPQGYYSTMSEAQIQALPPRWCLIRSADLHRAGWVAQRFITPDGLEAVSSETLDQSGDPLIDGAATLVRDLYSAFEQANTQAANPFTSPEAEKYFFLDIIDDLHGHGADVLYGAQDFQGEVTRIAADADQPMFRGMITINVDFTNFGQQRRAVFNLRADTARADAPFRIFRIDLDGWSFPE
ncbi:MAG TPA: hypothetical protein VJY83_07655 [Thiopseudomonas sp.]|nr:hypothetical protein [Thiopseudomonas sp.]